MALTIRDSSPHLQSVLRRRGLIGHQAFLDFWYLFALEQNASTEIDFFSKPSSDRNPRPARVALNILAYSEICDQVTLAAGFVACAEPFCTDCLDLFSPPCSEDLTKRVLSLARNAIAEPLDLGQCDSRDLLNVAVVACALWIDRARHFHLAPVAIRQERYRLISSKIEQCLKISAELLPMFSPLFLAWLRRNNSASL